MSTQRVGSLTARLLAISPLETLMKYPNRTARRALCMPAGHRARKAGSTVHIEDEVRSELVTNFCRCASMAATACSPTPAPSPVA